MTCSLTVAFKELYYNYWLNPYSSKQCQSSNEPIHIHLKTGKQTHDSLKTPTTAYMCREDITEKVLTIHINWYDHDKYTFSVYSTLLLVFI